MSHIEKAKAAINDRLAAAYRHREDPAIYHSELKGVLLIIVRMLADPNMRHVRLLQDLASKTLKAIAKVDNDEPARLD